LSRGGHCLCQCKWNGARAYLRRAVRFRGRGAR
jgi:hypothetical protein